MFIHNIVFIHDLFSSNGDFLSQKAIEDQIGTKLPFTVYFGIKMAIPKEWKLYMKSYKKTYNTQRPTTVDWLTKDKKRRPKLEKNMANRQGVQPIGQIRWAEKLEIPPDTNWKTGRYGGQM